MKIDINKKYRYRNGGPVRILAVDAKGPNDDGEWQPVIVLDENAGEVTFHCLDGKFSGKDNDELDLIEVREPREYEVVVSTAENTRYERSVIDGKATDDLESGDRRVPLGKWEIIRVREIID